MAEATLVATPNVTGGVPMDLVGDPAVAGVYLRQGADNLQLPIPTYDEDYAESEDSEGGLKVRSRPQNVKMTVGVMVKSANSPSGMLAFWKTWEQQIESLRKNKGTITYTPKDGTTPITYLIESAAITEAPQEEALLRQGYAPAKAEFTCRPFGLLPQTTGTLSDVDPFNRDSLTNQEWRFDAGGTNQLAVSGGQLVVTTVGDNYGWRPIRTADSVTTFKFTTGASVASTWWLLVTLKRKAATDMLWVGLQNTGGGASLAIYTDLANVSTQKNSPPAIGPLTTGTSYWVQAAITGNVVTAKLFSQDPNAVSNPTQVGGTQTYTLAAGAEQTTFGAGVYGSPGLRLNPKSDWTIDDWRHDSTTMESIDPVLNCELLNVPGSVSALMQATVTDTALAARNHVSIGVDDRYYDATAPPPTTLDSDVLVPIVGSGSTLTGAFDPGASGNSTIRATLSTSRQSIVSTGTQQHIGSRRILARVQGGGTGPVYARFVYRVGDGSFTKSLAGWRQVLSTQSGGGNWNEVDFGTIQIPDGAVSWEGRIEAFSQTNGDTLDIDYIEVLPSGRFVKATTPTDLGIASYFVQERFNQGAVNLTGQAVGGGATQSATALAATGADDATVGSQAWTSPGNITAQDGNYAAVNVNNATASHYLKATNFGFAIPAGGTIKGIQATVVNRFATGGPIVDQNVRIVKGGAISGAVNRASATTWPSSGSSPTYGGSTDLWGNTWLVSDINAANFGVVINVIGQNPAVPQASIDAIRMTVYYTDSAGNAWVITNTAGTTGQTDVTVNAAPASNAQRTTVSDANLDSGRWSVAGGGTYTGLIGAAISVFKTDQANAAGETYRGGLLLRYTNESNCAFIVFEQQMTSTPSSYVAVYKRVAGTTTLLAKSNFTGSLAGGRRVWATIDETGAVLVWVGTISTLTPTLVISTGDPVLATSGTLQNGKVGFYDAKTAATATTRNYDDFEVFAPDPAVPVISSSGSFVVDHQSALRAGGSRPLMEGPYLKVACSGREGRGTQLAVKAKRANVDYLPDQNIADATRLSVQLTPRVALLNP